MFNLSKDEISFEVVETFCREWQEGVRVEYKQEITNAVPKIVSSFANTQGGIFIIGVKENEPNSEEPFTIKGIPNTRGIEERIVQSSITGINPPVMPEVKIVPIPETENVIVVVRVDESPHAPHAIQNSTRVYIRHASITQPYEKPQLAQLDYIEYLLNRRQDPNGIIEPIINEMETRTQQFCDTTIPNMTVIIRPILPYRPVISPPEIYELFPSKTKATRVVGGVSYLLEPDSEKNLELNEYGLVYYRRALRPGEDSPIYVHDFIRGIEGALNPAKKFFHACDYLGNIKVTAHLKNVYGQELSKDFGTGGNMHLDNEPICYNNHVLATTSNHYITRDIAEPEHQMNIFEDLTMQLLWAFNIPTDNDNIRQHVAKLIEPKIDTEMH
ncbi:ATP-binding protein [Candidatus Poribacteria bacterium]|nr:ATP-binding protein [Candidatus Poribacteria bacterium]